jgi:hypothetical protein
MHAAVAAVEVVVRIAVSTVFAGSAPGAGQTNAGARKREGFLGRDDFVIAQRRRLARLQL